MKVAFVELEGVKKTELNYWDVRVKKGWVDSTAPFSWSGQGESPVTSRTSRYYRSAGTSGGALARLGADALPEIGLP
jgi:hypothetical protein